MKLHVLEAGDGPAVALLHGLFGRAQNLGTLARRLAPHYRVLSIDLRNHGASPHVAGMTYEALAGDVLETLADAGALPASLLGHSMGGKTAMAAALLAPAEVKSLLVADIAPVPYAHRNSAVGAAMLAIPLDRPMRRADADAALRDAVPDAGVRSFLLQNFLPGAAPAWRIGLANIANALPDIEGWPDFSPRTYAGPTLFVRGGLSDYVLPEYAPVMTKLFRAPDIRKIADAGHWLHADRPDEFADIVMAFLQA